MKIRDLLWRWMALVSSSTFIKSAAFNTTYFACCLYLSLMPFTPSIGHKIFVIRGLAKWQTIGTPPIGNSSKLWFCSNITLFSLSFQSLNYQISWCTFLIYFLQLFGIFWSFFVVLDMMNTQILAVNHSCAPVTSRCAHNKNSW